MILTGWKEIAKYLRYAVRTVQRWQSNGLPVKRVRKSPRSPVVADSEELDAWILHKVELPPGAPKKVGDNLQHARRSQNANREILKEIRARIVVLRKTLAKSRALRSVAKKGGGTLVEFGSFPTKRRKHTRETDSCYSLRKLSLPVDKRLNYNPVDYFSTMDFTAFSVA